MRRVRALFGCSALALCCSGAAQEGDLKVRSSEPEDYVGTQDEVESNLTDELATKLRQFDVWTQEGERQTADAAAQRQAAAEQQAAADAAASQSQAAGNGQLGIGPQLAHDLSAGPPGTDASSPVGRSAADPGQAAAATAATQAARAASQAGSIGQATPGAVGGRQSGAARGQRSPPARMDKAKVEDDVARMIREAAEQETDPERRKALMEQYDAYVRNI